MSTTHWASRTERKGVVNLYHVTQKRDRSLAALVQSGTCVGRTCTDAGQGLDHHPLVLEGAAGRLQDGEENLTEKHLRTRGEKTSGAGTFPSRAEAILTSSAPAPLYLDLHLQVNLEVGQQGEKDGQRELKHLGHGGDAVFGQSHAQVLLDGVDEHLVGAEHGPGALQHREQQLQGDDLGAQLVGSAG